MGEAPSASSRSAAEGPVGRAPPRVAETSAGAAVLGDVLTRLTPHLMGVVDDFYLRLEADPVLAEVLDRLTVVQHEGLKVSQVQHITALLTPDVDLARLHERSREIGRIHATVGVQMDWYVEAVADLRRGLLAVLRAHAPDLDASLAQSLVTDRFMGDLHGALLGYRDVDDAQHRVMLTILESVSDARTVSDLAGGVVEALGSLDGMAVCLFARASEGRIEYEFGAGPGFERFRAVAVARTWAPVTSTALEETGMGPMGRAWRSGIVQRSDSLRTDPTAAPWRDLAALLGWQSSASVPLVDRSGRSRALLSLQSYRPGFFDTAGRTAMLDQVKRVTERSLSDLEERPTLGAAITGYVDRAAHLAQLAAGRVEMHFQPQISLRDGALSKLEALARLRGDDLLVSPAAFLPAFGDDELFDLFEIGIHQSMTALRRWEGAGLDTGVSINLPVVSADDDRYTRLVVEVLEEYGVAPGRLTLELLETGFVDRELLQRRRSLDDFKAIGVRLAQDDLGSGYSSLLRLRHFAFDDVKLDQSLVRGTDASPGAALGFIKPINAIAHSLGLSVVVEGLESDGLIEVGVQLEVDEGQGYAIARPMPADEVVDWARGYRFDVVAAAPRTPIGALAGHVAWEDRATALAGQPSRAMLVDLGTCTLTSYVDRLGDPDLATAHREVHDLAVGHQAGVEHLAAWAHLSHLVTG
jgi:EAL domain-containing protein (putative c-di-GMP-specific phosphodiesterase class I)